MRKLIWVILGCLFIGIVSLIVYVFSSEAKPDEVVYAVQTRYAFLTTGKTDFDIYLYSNRNDSFLAYAEKANIYLEDAEQRKKVKVDFVQNSIINVGFFKEERIYNYALSLRVNATEIKIEKCYLHLDYDQYSYVFPIGSFSLKMVDSACERFKPEYIYGLSHKDPYLSTAAIVMKVTNSTKNVWKITPSANENLFVLSQKMDKIDDKITSIDEIMDYEYESKREFYEALILPNETCYLVFTANYDQNLYLYNTYLSFNMNNREYYIENFCYLNSNDYSQYASLFERGVLRGIYSE